MAIPKRDGWPASAAELSRIIYSSVNPGIQALEMMLMLEASGQHLYESLAEAMSNAEAAALMRKSAREEWGHAHRVSKAIRALTGVGRDVPSSRENPYCEDRDFSEVTAADLLAMAASERRGEALYEAWAAATPSADAARLFRMNAREERGHAVRLEQAARLLGAGA